ncbi:MAG: ATP synthase F1 subunit gamma [Myxococcota bacterium]|nr:ATP synthase F1 subunit gamma [Myxococcota bacterium]
MATLKELKTRIASVKSTEKITRAMKLVAAAKMKRATDAALASRAYSDEVTAVLQSLVARVAAADHPLLKAHDEVNKVAVIVVTADRGLCGGFNNNLMRRVENWVWEQGRDNKAFEDVELQAFGKKAQQFFSTRNFRFGRTVTELKPDQFNLEVAKLVADLKTRYESGELDEVYLAYNRFVNTLTQTPLIEKLFPLTHLASEEASEPEHLTDFVYEPNQSVILNEILPLFLRTRLTQVFLESEAGEHAARMTAMDNATRNAKDVIERLSLEYNRARQAAITTELVEIVAGAEAL